MVRVSFQRVAIAVLLVGLMIAPFGICLQPSHNDGHSCCMQPETSHSLDANCCVVRTHLPAILSAPTMQAASLNAVGHEYGVVVEATIADEHTAVSVIPPHSPQTGAFILRI
jgi:hypothetical protein